MEQNRKSSLLLAGASAGFVYWISLVVLIVTGIIKSQTGFFEGISNLVKSITQGGEGAGWMIYAVLAFFALLAASALNLLAYLRGGAIPAYIAAVLYLPSLNILSPALCVTGAKPRFLEGRKTMLFIAGYTGVILILLLTGIFFIPGMDADSRTMLTVLMLLTLAALVLNFFGWRTNNALAALAAGIVYVLSGLGILPAVLCFIAYAKLEKPFLRGTKTILFTALCTGAVIFLLIGILSASISVYAGKLFWVILALVTLAAVILNYIGWRKNNAALTLAAAIVYIVSILGIPLAVLCFAGRARLKKQRA
jgi:hypothetical protein